MYNTQRDQNLRLRFCYYGLVYSSHNANKNQLTVCQHWHLGNPCPSDKTVTDITINWASHAFQTCDVTSSTNHVWLKGKYLQECLLNTAWIMKKYRYWHWLSAMKKWKHQYWPKKNLSVDL